MTRSASQAHLIIIGGGITGLSAAWHLQTRARSVSVTLLEAASRWGGKIQTETMPGLNGRAFLADVGPESFITRKPELWDLALELGLRDNVIDPGSETRHMFVLEGGRPVPVPLDPIAFITSPLLSARGKLRLLAEPFIAPKRDAADESLAEFASRRLGREAMEKFIGPILAGIYNTDPERQSLLTTAPVMREMEKEHGGLFRGALGMARQRRRAANGSAPPPRFFTFADGAETVVTALAQKLRGDLRLNSAVERVIRRADDYAVRLSDGRELYAEAVIVATPANVAAGLVAQAAPEAASGLAAIRHNHIGTLSLAYRAEAVPARPVVNGLMIPRRERRAIDAITWTSRKLPGRAPAGASLLRVFFGGGQPETVELDDAALLEVVRRELRALLGITAAPLDYRAARWLKSFPQADVGHLERVAALEAALPPGLHLAGSSYRGIGVPDCVRQGREAADRALADIARAQPERAFA